MQETKRKVQINLIITKRLSLWKWNVQFTVLCCFLLMKMEKKIIQNRNGKTAVNIVTPSKKYIKMRITTKSQSDLTLLKAVPNLQYSYY